MTSFKLSKKTLYFLYAVVVCVPVLLVSYGVAEYKNIYALIALCLSAFGVFLIQYPSTKFSTSFLHVILPFHLTLGVILSLAYFPNLSLLLRLALMIFFGTCLYIISLVNNVFLVVEDRKESIPLFRAAVTWTQILVVVICIPYFAGIFKLPLNAFVQNGLAAISVGFFIQYLLWVFSLDFEFKKPTIGEKGFLISMCSIFTFVMGFSVSFIPTEAFLRALFIASILMLNTSLVYGHLRNSINKVLIAQHFIISAIFFVILLMFNP